MKGLVAEVENAAHSAQADNDRLHNKYREMLEAKAASEEEVRRPILFTMSRPLAVLRSLQYAFLIVAFASFVTQMVHALLTTVRNALYYLPNP
jgi:hypothetical protein